MTPKYDILRSLVPLTNHYFITMEEDNNQFKITCQNCNDFVTCKDRRSELLYITFLHYVLSTFELYIEYLDPENSYFQWPDRTKMQHMYQKFLKEGNVNHK